VIAGVAIAAVSADAAMKAPAVATGGASAITGTSAAVQGTVNPNGQATTYFFQFGATRSYGSQTATGNAGSGATKVKVTGTLTGLAPATTYHYRLVASNASGTTFGGDHALKTKNEVTIGASPNPIVFGRATTLNGFVLGSGTSGVAVTLQQATQPAGPYANAGKTTTGANGAYSFAGVAPAANTWYRTTAKGAMSAPLLVRVRVALSLAVSRRRIARGTVVRFSGRAAPPHDGLVVRIQRRGAHGRFRTVARARLRPTGDGRTSAYSRRLRVFRGGVYRTTVGPDSDHAAGFSPRRRIRVR
jgi:hypothetical protein